MTDTCVVKIIDEVNAVIIGLRRLEMDQLYERYAIPAKNYFFNPKFKLGRWDGKIGFFSQKTGKTYVQLLPDIIPIIQKWGYKIELKDRRSPVNLEIPLIDENYFSDRGIILAEHQVSAVNAATQNHYGCVEAGTGAGKAQPLYSKILTRTGWTTMGNVKIGDVIVTPENKDTRIVGIFPQGKTPTYRFHFSDKSWADSSSEHLWNINHQEKNFLDPKKKRVRSSKGVFTTEQIVSYLTTIENKNFTGKNISIDCVEPIEFNTESNISIPPYLLGILLGDGCIRNGVIFSSSDSSVVEKLKSLIPDNMEITQRENTCDYSISKIEKTRKNNVLKDALTSYGLLGCYSYEKFIPNDYLFATLEDRRELFAGLMDSDGFISKEGKVEFYTTSERLKNDVTHLAKSLGANVHCSIKSNAKFTYNDEEKVGRNCFILHISMSDNPFFLERKRERFNWTSQRQHQKIKRIVSFEYLGELETQCIMVDDPKHLYITDGFTITHNTFVNGAIVDLYAKYCKFKTITIVPTVDLVSQTRQEFVEKLGLDCGEFSGSVKDLNHQHVVSTWQTIQNDLTVMGQFQMVVCDEAHLATGPTLQAILNDNGSHIMARIGLTGTIPKDKCDARTVFVTLGPVLFTIKASELMEKGWLAQLDIKLYILEEPLIEEWETFKQKNPEEASQTSYKDWKKNPFPDYAAERYYIENKKARNELIAGLIEDRREREKGNCLVLVNSLKQGQKLAELIPGAILISGADSKKIRKEVYEEYDTKNDMVVIATYKLASTGLNIPRIFYLFLIDGGKGFTKLIQSIGRGLRKAEDKDRIEALDIGSDLKYSRKHYRERMTLYADAAYNFTKKMVEYC